MNKLKDAIEYVTTLLPDGYIYSIVEDENCTTINCKDIQYNFFMIFTRNIALQLGMFRNGENNLYHYHGKDYYMNLNVKHKVLTIKKYINLAEIK